MKRTIQSVPKTLQVVEYFLQCQTKCSHSGLGLECSVLGALFAMPLLIAQSNPIIARVHIISLINCPQCNANLQHCLSEQLPANLFYYVSDCILGKAKRCESTKGCRVDYNCGPESVASLLNRIIYNYI